MSNTATRWSPERAWEWYNGRPWFRGCNYLPSDCCNRIAMWQALDFETHLKTIDRELALAASIGYNSIRVILEYPVFELEHDSFHGRFERFLATASKHGILVMVCFGNDCTVPKNDQYRAPHLGPQEFDLGYHGGRKNSPHGSNPGTVGYSILDDPDTADGFFAMVREIVSRYASDPRICVWDLFNEPGNSGRGEISVPHVRRIFETARQCKPEQPLTTGLWRTPQTASPAEKLALELSDIISYHCYGNYELNIQLIAALRQLKRPLLNTEWLHRPQSNTVGLLFPLFYLERIGCWNWGLVAGLSQTYEPWQSIWRRYEAGETDLDLTKWQHDLFRPSLRPYDPKEIEVIRRYSSRSDEENGFQPQTGERTRHA